ncbi:hypothetical protein NL676_002598 [Syzygium grande]|nr:hypothetical protein NL676_002598 [Syzygium grande]
MPRSQALRNHNSMPKRIHRASPVDPSTTSVLFYVQRFENPGEGSPDRPRKPVLHFAPGGGGGADSGAEDGANGTLGDTGGGAGEEEEEDDDDDDRIGVREFGDGTPVFPVEGGTTL